MPRPRGPGTSPQRRATEDQRPEREKSSATRPVNQDTLHGPGQGGSGCHTSARGPAGPSLTVNLNLTVLPETFPVRSVSGNRRPTRSGHLTPCERHAGSGLSAGECSLCKCRQTALPEVTSKGMCPGPCATKEETEAPRPRDRRARTAPSLLSRFQGYFHLNPEKHGEPTRNHRTLPVVPHTPAETSRGPENLRRLPPSFGETPSLAFFSVTEVCPQVDFISFPGPTSPGVRGQRLHRAQCPPRTPVGDHI